MAGGACWSSTGCTGDVIQYQNTSACDAHSPAALAGRVAPTPDPKLTLRGLIEGAGGTYDRSFTPLGDTAIDQKAVASGKRRSHQNGQRAARAELDATRPRKESAR